MASKETAPPAFVEMPPQTSNQHHVVVVQRVQQPSRNWSTGLCGCFNNCGLCLLGYFCPCILAGQNASSVGDSCLLHGICFFFCWPWVHVFLGGSTRGQIRANNNIVGSAAEDYVLHWCCTCCALIQEAAEIKAVAAQSQGNNITRT
ncbi:cornifelin homolog [Glandiceps talaboti]